MTFKTGHNMHYKGKTDKIYYNKIKKLIFIKRVKKATTEWLKSMAMLLVKNR